MNKGFTLIEVLVAGVLMSVLALLAINQIEEFKKRGFDSYARADLRNAANAQEGTFVINSSYKSCTNNGCVSGINALEGLQAINDFTTLVMVGDADSFVGTATHDLGTGITYTWDSENGGMQ